MPERSHDRLSEGGEVPASRAIEHATTVVVDGLTVVFEVTYVDGPEGDRLAARQADAIAALLDWVEGQEPER